MISAQPVTNHFLWQNIQKWQNPLQNQHSDILHVAMQHSGLHSANPQPTVDLSFNLPPNSMPLATNDYVYTSYAFTSTQTSPASYVSFFNDQSSDETSLVSKTNATYTIHTHVQALLQLNPFMAQLLINRQIPNRPLSDWEHRVLQTTVSQKIWPNSFLSCITLLQLHNAILVWLYKQL